MVLKKVKYRSCLEQLISILISFIWIKLGYLYIHSFIHSPKLFNLSMNEFSQNQTREIPSHQILWMSLQFFLFYFCFHKKILFLLHIYLFLCLVFYCMASPPHYTTDYSPGVMWLMMMYQPKAKGMSIILSYSH